jgi:hypothetical protein
MDDPAPNESIDYYGEDGVFSLSASAGAGVDPTFFAAGRPPLVNAFVLGLAGPRTPGMPALWVPDPVPPPPLSQPAKVPRPSKMPMIPS